MKLNFAPVPSTEDDDDLVDAVAGNLAAELPTTRTLIRGTHDTLARHVARLEAKRAELQRAIAAKRAELRQVSDTIDGLQPAIARLAESEG